MPCCTFFGHRDCPASVEPKLRAVLVELIEHHGVDSFYVGRQGAFDAMVRAVLGQLKQEYPHIRWAVVLERLPGKRGEPGPKETSETIFPEGLEDAPPRWAIPRRNRWMLERADYVVAYVTRTWGGAAQFAARALRQGKTVIDLGEGAKQTKKP